MKKEIYTVLLLLVVLASCKPEYIKINSKLLGTWRLESFKYQNKQGEDNTIQLNNYLIEFQKNNVGIIKSDSIQFDFEYNFGYEQFEDGFADCTISVKKCKTLPINVIGRVQVYSYKFINNNTILFYTENEFDYIGNQVIKNATYTFVKI